MRNNPYSSDDPIGMQPTERMPPMDDLPLRQAPYVPPVHEEMAHVDPEIENAEARQEEARTVKFAIGKLADFLQWFVVALEIALAIRFVFRLIGADPNNVFAGFLYALTTIILFPFINIVPSPSIHPNQAFEFSTLIGMAIYYLFFWVLKKFLRILITEPKEPVT